MLREDRWLAGGLILSMTLLATSCVTVGRYDELEKQRDQLQAEVEDLQVRNRALQTRLRNVNQIVVDEGAVIQDQEAVIETQAEALAAVQGVYGELVDVLAFETGNGTVVLEVEGTVVFVNVEAEILFGSGSAELDGPGKDVVSKVATATKDLPFQVIVGGYTDDQPIGPALAARYPTNWELAAARAARVVRQLVDDGIPSSRLVAVSFGESHPVAPNDTPEGRAENRRIQLKLSPIVAG